MWLFRKCNVVNTTDTYVKVSIFVLSNTDNLNFVNLQAKYLHRFQELKQINLKNKIKPYIFSLISKTNLSLMTL